MDAIYTPPELAAFLASASSLASPNSVADFAAGDGALLKAAAGRWPTRLGKLVALSCLAPDIVTAIVEGRQPATLTAKSLSAIDLPIHWQEQRRALGF